MPGRRSTSRPPRTPSKKPRKPKGRSLNALAIAERQHPTRVKIQRHRLGEAEEEPKRRYNLTTDLGSGDDDNGDVPPSKRRKPSRPDGSESESAEEGSDGEGNRFRLGAVDSDDDSDLDSDEAMGESDEERFRDFSFRGSGTIKSTAKAKLKKDGKFVGENIDLFEGDNAESESNFDDLGDDAVDLATALDMNEEAEAEHDRVAAKTKAKEGSNYNYGDSDDESDDMEDSESPALSISDEEDEEATMIGLAQLQDFINQTPETSSGNGSRQRFSDALEQSAPSEFGVKSAQKLTVADLIPTVTDPRLKNSLKLLSSAEKHSKQTSQNGIPGKLSAPLPKRQQDRLDRAAAYEKSKETLGKWIDTVKHNRRAEHLLFPLVDQDALAAQGTKRFVPTSSSRPANDLEQTIRSILQESGLQASNGAYEESQIQAIEELQTNNMPLEEAQARRAEMRRARDLLFREEVRAKRIKKIKSKSFRRVHRKERQREEQKEREALIGAGSEMSEDEQELNDRRRAEERMGARHRSSRWAKGVKETGRAAWDEDARDGVTEMARKGEELRRRIEGNSVSNPDRDYPESSSSEFSDEISDLEDGGTGRRRDAENLGKLSSAKYPEPQSGLMAMKFMKSSEAAKKIANDAEVERLRWELEGEGSPSEDEKGETGRQRFGRQLVRQQPTRTPNPKASEFEEKLAESDNEDVEGDGQEIQVDASNLTRKPPQKSGGAFQTHDHNGRKDLEREIPEAENPWLSLPRQNVKRQRKAGLDEAAIITTNLILPSNSSPANDSKGKPKKQPRRTPRASSPTISETSLSSSTPNDADKTSSSLLHNNALVKAAFAGDDVFSAFAAEKDALVASEDEKELPTTLPGWGSWTGSGISKNRRPNKHSQAHKPPAKLIPGTKPSNRQDAALKNVTISEKRVRKNGKYLASQLPHPFESRAQYERSLRVPVGPEWTTKETFQNSTKPRVMVKRGVVVAPMERPFV